MRYFFIVLLSLAQGSWARFITEQEASIRYDAIHNTITVNKDFTTEWIVEARQTLLNESARENMKLVQLYYNADFESIEVLDAHIKNTKVEAVDHTLIEDKTLASQAIGFTDTRQISIPFKNVQVGSQIALKYKRVTKKPMLDNHFSTFLRYGEGGYWQQSTTTILSKIPLHWQCNDPDKSLKINTFKKDDTYHYTIELIKPLSTQTVNEPANSLLNAASQTWVSLSTDSTWAQFGQRLTDKYEAIVSEPLPQNFIDAAKAAKKHNHDADKINHVTAFIQDQIRYLGDWKTTEKGFYPRAITTITETQYGDCKDFATLTVAMLRAIGFNAKFAIVTRGEMINEYDRALPGTLFNHAMVYVQSPTGKIYWIDPTNNISMAHGLFSDIANRHTLVLDAPAQYIKIPAINADRAKSIYQLNYQIEPIAIKKNAKASFYNEQAIPYTGFELFTHRGIIEDYIYHHYTEQSIPKENRIKLILPDLTSRVVKDLDFTLEYRVDNPYILSNFGRALPLERYTFDYPEDSVHDIYLGIPQTHIKHYQFDREIPRANALNATIVTPWVNITRKGSTASGKTLIIDEYVIKKSYLTRQDRASQAYKRFKNEINTTLKSACLVIPEE